MGELVALSEVRVAPVASTSRPQAAAFWVEWATPADEERQTRQMLRSDATADGPLMVALLSEGGAPCHAGEAFRARLEPVDGWGVCEVCEFRWRMRPVGDLPPQSGVRPASRGWGPFDGQ